MPSKGGMLFGSQAISLWPGRDQRSCEIRPSHHPAVCWIHDLYHVFFHQAQERRWRHQVALQRHPLPRASGISQGIFQEITGTEKRLSGQTCSPFLLQALIGYGQDSPAYACISRPIAAANNGLAAAVDVKAPLNTASLSEYGSGKLCLPNTVMYAGPSTNSTLWPACSNPITDELRL